ncbi:hypothetical protein G6F57_022532 [Rhizopus arrhizus]|nr:hypothetical protein G6F57_022532 [Rhizopus arrhizus]
MKPRRMACAQRFAQAQRYFIAGDDRVGHLPLRHACAGRQCQYRRDGHHTRVQHGGTVRVVDFPNMGDGRIGECRPVGVHLGAPKNGSVPCAGMAVPRHAAGVLRASCSRPRPAGRKPIQESLGQTLACM